MSSTSSNSAHLVLDSVTVGYDGVAVVKDVSLELADGEIGCLLGPSGCGKSTLLRSIAGLEPVMAGEISLDKTLFSKRHYTLPSERRGVGMVFQDMALFPHFTVSENICFGLRKWSAAEKIERVHELLSLVGLEGMQDRYPHELSGGQQQRIALVRAMGPRPKLLLLDEPFSGLDASLRESLVADVRDMLVQAKMSALLVTHDQMEAFAVADKVALMNEGSLVQCANPFTIYHNPANQFVADFIGVSGFLKGVIVDDNQVESTLGILTTNHCRQFSINQAVQVLVRPGDIVRDDASQVTAEIIDKQFRGSHFLYRIRLSSDEELFYLDSSHHHYALGEFIPVSLVLDEVVMFDDQGVACIRES